MEFHIEEIESSIVGSRIVGVTTFEFNGVTKQRCARIYLDDGKIIEIKAGPGRLCDPIPPGAGKPYTSGGKLFIAPTDLRVYLDVEVSDPSEENSAKSKDNESTVQK